MYVEPNLMMMDSSQIMGIFAIIGIGVVFTIVLLWAIHITPNDKKNGETSSSSSGGGEIYGSDGGSDGGGGE